MSSSAVFCGSRAARGVLLTGACDVDIGCVRPGAWAADGAMDAAGPAAAAGVAGTAGVPALDELAALRMPAAAVNAQDLRGCGR